MEKYKNISLTYMLRHEAWLTLPYLQRLITKYNVSPYLGALPGVLCKCVTGRDIAAVTDEFRRHIDEFVISNRADIVSLKTVMTYNWDAVSKLFGTPCVIEIRNRGNMPWRGAIATVGRITFPVLGVQYALKVFTRDKYFASHGPWYEIPAAFSANAAEPKDNNPIHMASFGVVKYMLSDWAGDDEGWQATIRTNRNEIFATNEMENHSGNYRAGRRIDYGRTYRTVYGASSYRVRKIYRKLLNAARNKDTADVLNMAGQYSNVFAQRDFQNAMELVGINEPAFYWEWLQSVLQRSR